MQAPAASPMPGKANGPPSKESIGPEINRSAFVYMDPRTSSKFAQCATCRWYLPGAKLCAILGKDKQVLPNDTCALYVYGDPDDSQEVYKSVGVEESGYIRAQVRCENCASFDGGDKCKLFKKVNQRLGDIFKLDEKVHAQGCCNAWNAK